MNKSLALVALSALLALASGCVASHGDVDSLEEDADSLEEDVGTAQSPIEIANATVTSLCVAVADSTNSGTTNDVGLNFLTSTNDYWSCTITGGAATGTTPCCVPTRTHKENTNTDNREAFYIQFLSQSSTDGLKIAAVIAHSTAGDQDWPQFSIDINSDVEAEGCFANDECNSFWLDGDGHQDCWKAKIWNKAGDGTKYIRCQS